MDIGISELVQLINGVGFPIVACGALFWMLNNSFKQMQGTLGDLTSTLDDVRESLDQITARLDKLEERKF